MLAPRAATDRLIDIAVRGGAVRAQIAGEGPALLLLHGWSLDRRMWRPQIEAFSARHQVIAIDRRGFGESTAPPDLTAEIEDVGAVLDALALERCALFGMSQAARVALSFAQCFPARVAGLVVQGAPLEGAAAAPGSEEIIPTEEYRALVRAGDMAEMKRRLRRHPLTLTRTPAAQALVERMIADYDARDLLAAPSAPVGPRLEDLAGIGAPVFAVAGAQDAPHRRRVADLIATATPRGARIEIANSGHVCNLCNPAEYNAKIGAALATLHARP